MNEVTLNDAAIARFLHDQNGPLARMVLRRSRRIHDLALANLGPHHRSGDLEAGMKVTALKPDASSISVLVGSDATHPWQGHAGFPYGYALEHGGTLPQGGGYEGDPWLTRAVIADGFRPE